MLSVAYLYLPSKTCLTEELTGKLGDSSIMASIWHSATVTSVLILAVHLICCSQQVTGVTYGKPATCPTGYKNCGDNHKGRCLTYVKTNVNNCGDCGVKCSAPPHSSPACSNFKCGFTCTKAYKNCDLNDQNGCETCVQVDINNCGDCGKKCPLYANTLGPKCFNSTCTGVCQTGWKDCNNNLAVDGCEAQLKSDIKNCGACGVRCANAANADGVCCYGKCGIQCYQGFANCDRKEANGCEVALNTDISNCGTCGHKCFCPPHSNPTCAAGKCGYICKDGYTDCNGLGKDGCEITLASDVLNCGACGAACSIPYAQPVCSSGTCGIKCCNKGFNDCNGLLADGCEVTDATLQVDTLNCGECGNKCTCPPNAIPTCADGVCGFTCKSGFEDCNGDAADGCEVALDTDPLNCGGCENKCDCPNNSLPTCAAGSCGYTCKDGFKDCNGEAADGCEVDITTFQTDVMNCGDCNNMCPCPLNAIPYCTGGECGFTCKDGFKDCNGEPEDGCEVAITDDIYNCGACANSCEDKENGFHVCKAGTCCPCGSDQDCETANTPKQSCLAGWCS